MRILLLSFFLCFGAAAFGGEGEVCEAYQRLQGRLHCEPDGYLLGTGYPLCQRFVSIDDQYSLQGRLAMASIRRCLVSSLEAKEATLTCTNVEQEAYDTHVNCYVAAGFCRLPSADQWLTYAQLKSMFLKPLAWEQFLRLTAACESAN